MIRYIIYIGILFIPFSVFSQDSFIEEFEGDILSSQWFFDFATYEGSVEDDVLKVDYNRTADSWLWDQFNIQLASNITITENPFLSIKIKSDENINLVLKPENTVGGSDWLEQYITGDGEWKEYFFELSNAPSQPIEAVYIYFDAGSTTEKMANVEIDYISMGGDNMIPLDTELLEQAIKSATQLEEGLVIGLEDGNNLESDLIYLQSSIITFQSQLDNLDVLVTQAEVDSMAYALYDICTQVEQSTFYDLPMVSVDDSMVYSAKILLQNLHEMKGPRFMYGMHDATGYGVNWSGDDDRSDVKDVSGSYPAFFSWDANGVVRNQSIDRLSYRIKTSNDLGAVTSFCWHQYDPEGVSFYSDEISSPNEVGRSLLPGNVNNEMYKEKLEKIGNYAKSTRGSNGRSIPIIFRPYHEHNGWWFWWGSNMPESDYIELWQYTVDYLRDSLNVHNFIYAFSPDGGQISTIKPYEYRYPGDEYVDILGLDYYFGSGADTEISRFINFVESTVLLADSLGKVAAVTEIGDRNALEINNWHTKVVLEPIKNNSVASKIAYLSTWRNADPDHHFAPYPGHKSVLDFLEFYSDTTTIFLNNMVKGISDSLYTSKLNEKSDAAFMFNYKLDNGPVFSVVDSTLIYDGPLVFNYTNTTPIFNYSQLAKVSIDGELQVSDSSTVNLSLPTTYTIVSENELVSRDYEVILDELITTSNELAEEEDFAIDLYPLPAREFLNIESSEIISDIHIKSMNGQIINSFININTNKYQLTSLAPGVVILEFNFKNGKTTRKKIIVH